MSSRLLILALAAAAAVPAAGAAAQSKPAAPPKPETRTTTRWSPRDAEERSRLDTTIAFGPNGSIDLRTVSGDIKVSTWSRNEAKITAVVEDGELRVSLSSSSIRLEVDRRRGWGSDGDEQFTLVVPVGTKVVANSVSGDISVRGAHAPVEAQSVSGEVAVDDALDRVELQSVSGGVRGAKLAGTVHVQAVSGDVEVRGVTGELSVEAVSGDVRLLDVTSSDVRAQSVSGEMEYQGTIADNGRYEFKSHSGDVTLGVPASAKASVTMRTFSGEIESDFPMTYTPGGAGGRKRDNRMDFTINGGGARLQLETFSGDIHIRRGALRTGKED